jgi:hypothetical protein
MKRTLLSLTAMAVVAFVVVSCSKKDAPPTAPAAPTATPTITDTPTVTNTPTITYTPTNTPIPTADPTQVPSCTWYGVTEEYSGHTGADVRYLYMHKQVLAGPTTIHAIGVSVSSASAGLNVQLGLYSDASGEPNARLVATEFFTTVAGVNYRVINPIVVPAGTYWIAAFVNESGTTFNWPIYAPPGDPDTSGARYKSNFLDGALPATAPVMNGFQFRFMHRVYSCL